MERGHGALTRVLTRSAVPAHTLLLLERVGQVGELGGRDGGHLVDVAAWARHHHPVQVVHQLRAVRVERDVGGGHPGTQRQRGLRSETQLQTSSMIRTLSNVIKLFFKRREHHFQISLASPGLY